LEIRPRESEIDDLKFEMKVKALLKTESKDAKSVASALDVDNIDLENLRVATKTEKDRIITKVESNSMSTLISTLDDIISCQITAEKIIE
jgi:hypothetical protein